MRLTTPVSSKILFKQNYKGELRNFFSNADTQKNETNWRTRIKLDLEFTIYKNIVKDRLWYSSAGTEWYVNEDKYSDERFASSREYFLEIGYKFAIAKRLSITYGFETFSDQRDSSNDNGHTLSLKYSL